MNVSMSKHIECVGYPVSLLNMEKLPKSGSFAVNVEKVLMAYSKASRYDGNPDVEVWVEKIVEHSLNVAVLCRICQPDYKYVILDNCRRLLQVNQRAVELSVIVSARMGSPQIRKDLELVQETVKDELLELEVNVNFALVGLIVDVFTETTEPIEDLTKAILYSCEDRCYTVPEFLQMKFIHHSTQICLVASFVAASSSDAKGINQIESAVSGLQKFQMSAVSVVRDVPRMASVDGAQCVEAVERGWSVHLSSLLHILYDITQPEIFLKMLAKSIHSDICVMSACFPRGDERQAAQCLLRILGRSEQFSQCACHNLNNSADGIYRIGFQVYINQLNSAINSLQDVAHQLLDDLCNARYKELIEMRLNELHRAIREVRLNVSKVNPLDIQEVIKHSAVDKIKVNKSAFTSVCPYLQKFLPRKPDAQLVTSDEPSSDTPEIVSRLKLHQTLPVSSQDFTIKRKRGEMSSFSSTSDVLYLNNKLVISALDEEFEMNVSNMSPPDSLYEHSDRSECRLRNHSDSSVSTAALRERVSACINRQMESSSSSELQCVSEELVKSLTAKNKGQNDCLLSDLLHWTKSTISCGQKLLLHSNLSDKSELKNLCCGIELLSSKICDTLESKGDVKKDIFLTDCKTWSLMLDRACVLIDEVVGQWKNCTDLILKSAADRDEELIASQVDILLSYQQTMTDLLTRVASFSTLHNMTSQSLTPHLKQATDDLVEVTRNIKTLSSDSDDGVSSELSQRCRQWAVEMFCSQRFLESASSQLIDDNSRNILGLTWSEIDKDDAKLFQQMNDETINIGGLLDCVSVGNDENKSRSSELVSEITSVMEELQTCVRELSPLSNIPSLVKLQQDVLIAQWIMKVIEAQEMIKAESKEFIDVLDHFVTRAVDINKQHGDELKLSEFTDDLNHMTNNVLAIQKKVLLAIKISPNLVKRDLIGRYLSELASLTQTLGTRLNSLASSGDNLRDDPIDPEVSQLKVEWAAKMKRLTLTLVNMPDVRTSLVPEIKKLLNSVLVHPSQKPAQNKTSEAALSSVSRNENESFAPKREDNSYDIKRNKKWKENTVPGTHQYNSSYTTTACSLLYQDPSYTPWADDSNTVVKLARRLTDDLLSIEQFCRSGHFDTDGINMVFERAQSLAEIGSRMESFFKVLIEYSDDSLVGGLLKQTELIATCSSQLRMISSGLQNTAKTAETVLMLLQNSKNLMSAVLGAFVAAEVVSFKGLQKPIPEVCSQDNSILDLVIQWQRSLLKFQANENSCAAIDKLGLRHVDPQCSPSLTDVLKIPPLPTD